MVGELRFYNQFRENSCSSFWYKGSHTFNNAIMVDLSQLLNVLDSSSWQLFFTKESKRSVSFLEFGTNTRRFSNGKVAKTRWFGDRTRTSFSYGVTRRHFRKKIETGFEISGFQRIRTSLTYRYQWLVWQPQHDLLHAIKYWTKNVIYVKKSLIISLKMVELIFSKPIFGVLNANLWVI